MISELLRGAHTQGKVIFAVAVRETRTRYGDSSAGYAWAMIEPAFYIGTFFLIFTFLHRRTPGGMDLFPFLMTGVMTYQLMMKIAERVGSAIESNKALLYYPQVQTLDLVIARAGLELATYLAMFVVMMGVYALSQQELVFDSLLRTMVGLLLGGLLGTGLGTIFCSLNVLSKSIDRLRSPFMRPLFWTSGVFYTADSLPPRMREFMLWNPLLHCVEIVRSGWFLSYDSHCARVSYVLIWIIGLFFVGLTLERAVRRRIQLS